MVMENLAPFSSEERELSFDLKGSTKDRSTRYKLKDIKKTVLKDENFLALNSKKSLF